MLGNVLSDEEMGKITGILAKQQDFPASKQEAIDCLQILGQSLDKQIESNDDLISLIQKRNSDLIIHNEMRIYEKCCTRKVRANGKEFIYGTEKNDH